MANFCGRCGRALEAGRCPVCDAPRPAPPGPQGAWPAGPYGGAYFSYGEQAGRLLAARDPFVLANAAGLALYTLISLLAAVLSIARTAGGAWSAINWLLTLSCAAVFMGAVRTWRGKNAFSDVKTLGFFLFGLTALSQLLFHLDIYYYQSDFTGSALLVLLFAYFRKESAAAWRWAYLAGFAAISGVLLFYGSLMTGPFWIKYFCYAYAGGCLTAGLLRNQ